MVMGKAMVPPVLPFPAWHRTGVDRRFLTEAVRRATLPGRPRLEVLGPAPSAAGSVGLVAGSFDPMTAAHAAFAEALDTELTLLVWSPATLPKEAGPGGDPSAALLLPEDRLFSRAEVAVASRAGDHAEPNDERWSDRIRTVVLPPGLAGLSSRAVRAAVRRGEDVSRAVPPEILPFVRGPARGGGGERDPGRLALSQLTLRLRPSTVRVDDV